MSKQMREILFRGKRVDNGKWVYGNHLYDSMTGKHFIIPFDNISESTKVNEEGCCYCVGFEVISETVGQYTVLPDKNGKKIFEGDIVKIETGYRMKVGFGKYWDSEDDFEAYGWYLSLQEWEMGFNGQESNYAEVIGNIHDNPELLEET